MGLLRQPLLPKQRVQQLLLLLLLRLRGLLLLLLCLLRGQALRTESLVRDVSCCGGMQWLQLARSATDLPTTCSPAHLLLAHQELQLRKRVWLGRRLLLLLRRR